MVMWDSAVVIVSTTSMVSDMWNTVSLATAGSTYGEDRDGSKVDGFDTPLTLTRFFQGKEGGMDRTLWPIHICLYVRIIFGSNVL